MTAQSMTASYTERGTGPAPEPPIVVDQLRTRLDPQTFGDCPRALIAQLTAADHLEMWNIMVWGYDRW
jgi:hypothetical protein